MKITASEVGIFRAKYSGVKPCENPDYFMAKLSFEVEVAGQVKDWNTIPSTQYLLHEASEDAHKFAGLQEGQAYLFKMAISYQSANERNGKTYPAGIKFKVLQVVGEAK